MHDDFWEYKNQMRIANILEARNQIAESPDAVWHPVGDVIQRLRERSNNL